MRQKHHAAIRDAANIADRALHVAHRNDSNYEWMRQQMLEQRAAIARLADLVPALPAAFAEPAYPGRHRTPGLEGPYNVVDLYGRNITGYAFATRREADAFVEALTAANKAADLDPVEGDSNDRAAA